MILEAHSGTAQRVAACLGADVIAAPAPASLRQATQAAWLAGQPAAVRSCLQPLFGRCALHCMWHSRRPDCGICLAASLMTLRLQSCLKLAGQCADVVTDTQKSQAPMW